jgi:hypothetical protein
MYLHYIYCGIISFKCLFFFRYVSFSIETNEVSFNFYLLTHFKMRFFIPPLLKKEFLMIQKGGVLKNSH